MSTPNVADFFRRVVPWPAEDEPGYINIHWKSANAAYGMPGRPFRDVITMMAGVQRFQNKPATIQDIYFCLSRQLTHGKADQWGKHWAKRTKTNTVAIKCVALDVDVKLGPKGYADAGKAMEAIGKFVADSALPFPTAIVHSGGGLHVYWISARPLTIEEWTPYASGLRNLADSHGLRFDQSVTIDCARVLRVPGTFNLKEEVPRPVTLKYLAGADLNFETTLGHIRSAAGVRQAADAVASELGGGVTLPPGPGLTTDESLADGIVDEKPPLDPAPIVRACPFLAETARTGGKGHEQGLWMQTALACTFMENGRQVFHVLSEGDPRYDPDTVDKMFDRKLAEREEKDMGWPQCSTFENFGSQQCAGCPFKGKVRSPLNLPIAQPASPITQARPDPRPEPAPEDIESGVWIPDPYYPHPKTGFVMINIEKDRGPKGLLETPTEVLRYKITKIWPQYDTGINFTVDRNEDGVKDVVVTYEDLGSDQAIGPALAKQKITVHNNKIVGGFMKTLIEEYQKRKRSLATIPFGWYTEEGQTDPNGWAYGGIVRKADGSTMPSAKGDLTTRVLYEPKGEKDVWFRALKLITEQHRPDVEVITAVAFASPLLRFTGHFSGALVARSKSGGNKSTAVNVGGAVWGHPRKAKFTPTASSVGIRLRLAQINNLPCYWDDIRKEQVPAAAALLSDLTQGADGLKSTADRRLQETGSWQTIMCICANGSLFDHFAEHNKSDAAGLYRIFEYEVSDKSTAKGGRVVEWEATYLQQQLEENFGRIGERYSWLLANADHIMKMLRATQEHLARELKYAGQEEERFWFALVSTILLGAKLANEIGASFNVEEIHHFLLDAYKAMRTKLRLESPNSDDKLNLEHALTEFFQEYGGNMLWSTDMITGPGPRQRVNQLKGPEKDKDPVYVHWVTNERLLRIQKNKLREFLNEHEYTSSAVFNGLKKHFNADESHRQDLSAGTTYTAGKMWLITIPVPVGSPFENALFAHTAVKSIRSGQLEVVGGTQGTG